MNLQNLVPSLETCQKLKEAGFRQDTLLYWRISKDNNNYESHVVAEINGNYYKDKIAAPTLGEIELPDGIIIEKEQGKFFICEKDFLEEKYAAFDSEVDAKATAWLILNSAL